MKDYLKRSLRTYAQSFIGTVMSFGVLNGMVTDGVLPGYSAFAQLGIAAAASGIIAVLSYTQNWLEESKNITILPK